MRPGRFARRGIVALAAVAVLTAAGAGSVAWLTARSPAGDTGRVAAGPRPVTAAQADRLAVMRLNNHRSTGVHFTTRVSSARGPLRIEGDVDYRAGAGYATIAGAGSSFTLQWSGRTLLAWPAAAGATTAPPTLPRGAPARRALAPARSLVDAVLAVVLELGRDRPDNAQIIRRSGATWLRRATVGPTPVDVIESPDAAGAPATGSGGALTYWIDARGRLLRLEARFGAGPSVTRIDLVAATFRAFPRSGALRP